MYVGEATKDQFWSDVNRKITLVTDDATIAGATSGDLVIYTNDQDDALVGIAENNYDNNQGQVVLATDCAYRLPVTAIKDGPADSAVVFGSRLYWNATASRIDMVRADTGIYVGMALEGIAAGQTATIPIWLFPIPAEKTLA
jgi:hypothetical protein